MTTEQITTLRLLAQRERNAVDVRRKTIDNLLQWQKDVDPKTVVAWRIELEDGLRIADTIEAACAELEPKTPCNSPASLTTAPR